MRVLLIEDNAALARWTARNLTQAGLLVDCVGDGDAAEQALRGEPCDVVLLDLGLPKVDGLTLLRRLRAAEVTTPVLVLTARGAVEDRVAGLDAGADDYLVKPFDASELEARIRALVRRAQGAARNVVKVGELQYETKRREFSVGDQLLELTPREREVLEVLVGHANQPVRKQSLSDRIVALDGWVSLEAIEIYVSRLRRKLEGSGARIRTLRGLGYMLEAGSD